MFIFRRTTLLFLLVLVVLDKTKNGSHGMRPFRAIDVLTRRTTTHGQISSLSENKNEHHQDVEELYIEQPLDHDDLDAERDTAVRTFQQRYFYTSRYVVNPSVPASNGKVNNLKSNGRNHNTNGGQASHYSERQQQQPQPRSVPPTFAFLCVGGEGPSLDKSVLVDSVHCSGDMIQLAKRLHETHGASFHLFALEHRYYGSSYPVFPSIDGSQDSSSPVTNDHLVYLSSRQALADLADFITHINNHSQYFSQDNNNQVKWITFGGSYPGMMAAWARLQYPHLVHAAVSNSAPVEIQLVFSQYKEWVAFDLQYETIGGSKECLQIVSDGHLELSNMLSSKDKRHYQSVADLFGICNGTDALSVDMNVRMWLGDGVIDVPAQENDPNCEGNLCNIQDLCMELIAENKKSSPVVALAAIAKKQRGSDDCTVIDWDATISYLASPAAQEGGTRSWLWQTCNEFGYYQTCDEGTACPFAKGYHHLDMDFEICEKAYGIDRYTVRKNAQDSLNHYGGWDIPTTRVLSTNGDVDPWSVLAITGDKGTEDRPTHTVKGASHHFWTHKVQDTDGDDVMRARELIYKQVSEWLGVEESSASPVKDDVEISPL